MSGEPLKLKKGYFLGNNIYPLDPVEDILTTMIDGDDDDRSHGVRTVRRESHGQETAHPETASKENIDVAVADSNNVPGHLLHFV